MTARERVEHWDAVYRNGNPERFSWFQAVPELSVNMIDRAGLRTGDAVLDVGAGNSSLAGLLAGRRLRVTALDVSTRAIELARHRVAPDDGAIEWVVAAFLEWPPARRFRLVHDRAVFHFLVDPHDRSAYLERLRAVLDPGGHVVLMTFAPDGPRSCSDLAVERYSAEQLIETLGPGFRLEYHRREMRRTPAGRGQRFTSILACLADPDRAPVSAENNGSAAVSTRRGARAYHGSRGPCAHTPRRLD